MSNSSVVMRANGVIVSEQQSHVGISSSEARTNNKYSVGLNKVAATLGCRQAVHRTNRVGKRQGGTATEGTASSPPRSQVLLGVRCSLYTCNQPSLFWACTCTMYCTDRVSRKPLAKRALAFYKCTCTCLGLLRRGYPAHRKESTGCTITKGEILPH